MTEEQKSAAELKVGYFDLLGDLGRLFIFLSAASFASAARLSRSYVDMVLG